MDVKEVIYSAEKVSVLNGVDPLVSIMPSSGHCWVLLAFTVQDDDYNDDGLQG